MEKPIQVSVPGCPLGFLCEPDDLAVRLQPLVAIGSEIPAQLIAFLNNLFQMGIHPGISLLRTALVGTECDSAFLVGNRRPPNVLTGTRQITPHGYRYRGKCGQEANLLWCSLDVFWYGHAPP